MSEAVKAGVEHEALARAALTVATREGLAQVTPARVAREVGLPEPSVEVFFRDPGTLYGAIAAAVNRRLRTGLTTPVGSGGTLEEFLVGGMRGLSREIERHPDETVLAVEIASTGVRTGVYRRGAARQRDETGAALREFLDTAAGVTSSRWTLPVVNLTDLSLGTIGGVVLGFAIDRDGGRCRRRLETFARTLARCAVPVGGSARRPAR